MRRRQFAGAAAASLLGTAARRVGAQGLPRRRVGVLAPSSAAREAVTLAPFFEQMAQLGWVEGVNMVYDRAYADDQYPQLPRLAQELVARRPELIFAPPMPAAAAARAATDTIAIVFATGTDPIGAGLVRSLAHPGGNATGMISVQESLAPKTLQLALQMLPSLNRLGLLGDPRDPRSAQDRAALTPPLATRGMRLIDAEATDPQSLEAALAGLVKARAQAVMTNSSLSFNLRQRVVEVLGTQGIAVIGHRSEMVEDGALMSYGAALHDQIRRAALVVDRVLRGTRPQDIPVEQPTLFELALNLRTAAAMGVQVPPLLRLQATRVVE